MGGVGGAASFARRTTRNRMSRPMASFAWRDIHILRFLITRIGEGTTLEQYLENKASISRAMAS